MKKFLLTIVAAVAITSASAQQVKNDFMSAKQALATAAPVSYVMDEATANRKSAPRKTVDSGVWYSRPAGSMWGWWGSPRSQMYMPFLASIVWQNQSLDKTGAWTLEYDGNVYDLDTDEDGNGVDEVMKVNSGYINPYGVPYYAVGDDKYIYGEETGFTPWLFNGEDQAEVMNVLGAAGYYYGFSDANVFGTFNRTLTVNEETVNVCTYRVREFYKKPLAPMCIFGIEGRVNSYSGSLDMIPEGKEVKAHFIRTVDGQYGPEETTDTIGTIIITKDNLTGEYETNDNGVSFNYLEASRVAEDIFGNEYVDPIIVDDQFVISIEGFDQEGVDFGFYMADVKGTAGDYYGNGGVFPTLFDYRDAEGNTYDGYWQYNTSRQYNMFLQLNVLTDIVRLYDDFNNMTAPVEGGNIYAEVEEEDENGETVTNRYGTIQFQSTKPWVTVDEEEGGEGVENYYFEDLPDWLTVGDVIDTYYTANYNYALLVQVTAEPLPEGVKGRKAEIRIVSDYGADSGVITVTQGEVDDTGVNTVNAAKNALNGNTYNLAGQQVNSQFKGIVVENGKKAIR